MRHRWFLRLPGLKTGSFYFLVDRNAGFFLEKKKNAYSFYFSYFEKRFFPVHADPEVLLTCFHFQLRLSLLMHELRLRLLHSESSPLEIYENQKTYPDQEVLNVQNGLPSPIVPEWP